MRNVTRKVEMDPAVIYHDGKAYGTKRTITTVSDVQQTAIGPVDFGHVVIGPAVPAIGEVVSFDVKVRTPWWAFWRKPKTERQQFKIVGAFPPLTGEWAA